MDESEVEKLRAALRAAERRADTAEQRADSAEQRVDTAEQRADTERQRADTERQRANTERQRADTAEQQIAKTSFPQFIQLCHEQFTVPLRVESNLALTTIGSITKPQAKKHPTNLRPWEDFPHMHQRVFDAAYNVLCKDGGRPLFPPRIALEVFGNLCGHPLTSEKDLESYDRFAVGMQVQEVLRQLLSSGDAQHLVNGCAGVEFSNYLNALQQGQAGASGRPRPSAIDPACVFRDSDGKRSLLLVREYKAAHKLSPEHLRAGLRPMDVRDEVVQRTTIPNDPAGKIQYHADRLVAAAVTQTFEYMIDNGLEYGSFTTGVAEVYLRVLEDDPATVYYYLTEPQLDVVPTDPNGFRYPFTAVSRLLGFCLMAMHSPVRSQSWRQSALKKLHLWVEDFEEILRQIPDDERHQSPHGSEYSSPQYPVDPRSPSLLRKRKLILERDDEHGAASFRSDSSSEDSGDTTSAMPETPTRGTTAKRKRTSTDNSSGLGATLSGASRQQQQQTRPYCTMKCLVGLRLRRSLDPACPNYAQHRLLPNTVVHEIGLNDLVDRVRCQLNADMDHNCDPLGIQGARGVLFRVTEVSHGYTFVAKGTIDELRQHLRHEGQVYQRLLPIQGSATPVYLGNIDLDHPYFYDVGVKIVHMVLMSWGGFSLYERSPAIDGSLLEREKQRSMREVSQLLVVHGDLRLPNMLWNDEAQRVLLIDFERAHLQPQKRKKGHHSDSEISPLRGLERQRRRDFAADHPLRLMQSTPPCT
ncbi:uncharacterized protein Z520_12281 [Fonsecaea multimorphosa CBS 102226]|uniref:Aminoglycoside phosphotransferase domain-containing protein n=1 Tax=Fonsecaea multimorphosa CBS 102226 TaxID=1442371 RepID=A0A0D2GR62_9EURO|nr:uncharacterized protein Z520_12281 [Fonsecaea multimorphosa CBS 102226]KIX92010.1 hypothetical protein Z520_12281 [Fonsecaea multimorphosa CBS 102226]OAL17367.1 hypothetical protein AYO22_11734 [Fonsecaea multimorphosa]